MPQASHRIHRAVYITLLATIALIVPTIIAGLRASASDLPGIISRWSAEGNANDSVGSNNGTLRGGVTFVSGVVGQAFSFDGIDDEIVVNSTFPFHVPGDGTLSFWLNTPATGHQSVFWTRADDSDLNRFNIFVNGNSTIGFDYRSPNGTLHTLVGNGFTGVAIQRNTWTHLAITRTGNVYSLYVNGSLAASATDSFPDLPTATGWQMSGRGGFMYLGRLDEVEIYNRAVTSPEIQSLITEDLGGRAFTYTSLTSSSNSLRVGQPVTFTATVSSGAGTPDGSVEFFDGAASLGVQPLSGGTASITVPTLTLGQHSIRAVYAQTANYKESSATLTVYAHVTDSMGRFSYWSADGNAVDSISGHNGTLENGATFAPGVGGQAFSFNGASYVEVPDSGDWAFGANPFTIALWAKFSDPSGGPFIASDDGSGGQRKWIFSGGGSGLSFHTNGPNGEYRNFIYTGTLRPGQWYHLAVTRDGSTFALYVNGVQVTSSTDSVVIPDASAPLTIGQAEGQFFFNGLIDEIGIYDRALSTAEIQSIFNDNVPPPSTPIIFGSITNASGQPLSGVTMTLSGSQTATTTTTQNGFYYFDGLAANGAYTVTPSKTNYTFVPASQTFSNLTISRMANFTGLPTTDLSVSITSSGWAIMGYKLLYRIKITNYGPETVDATLTSMVPGELYPAYDPEFILTGDYIGYSTDGDHFTFGGVTAEPGGTSEFDLVVTPTELGTISNTVSVIYPGDINSANNTATATATVVPLPVPTGSACATPPPGAVAWWPGDGNAKDITAGHDGTLQNGATFAPGVSGQAFSFGGSTDSHIEVPDSSAWSFGTNPFTIALWARFDTTGKLIASNDVGDHKSWTFRETNAYLVFSFDSPEYEPIYLVNPGTYQTNRWYHLAVTREGTTYTFYINGIAVHRATDSHVIADASGPLTIGEDGFNGLIDEIGIYNRALSPAEIQSIFNAGSFGQCKTASFTETGSNVTVLTDAATFTFDNVSTPGTTSVSSIDPATVGQVPGGFAVSNSVAYEIGTTATFTGSVTLAFKVPGPISQTDFNSLAILHNVNGALVDVTATTPARDYSTLTIYATTSSFSPFYLARRGPHINPLFDQTKAYKSGSTIPVKLQLLSASNSNLSSSGTALVARDLKLMSGNTTAPVVDSGNSNPDSTFRYDPTIGGTGGGYIFNLSTRGLAPGQYVLSFYVGSDRSFIYTVKFEVK